MRLTIHSRKPQMRGQSRFLQQAYLTGALVSLLLIASMAKAGLPNPRLCFPDVISTPDTFLTPPNLDGIVVGDNGWTSSFRYVFQNGTPDPNVVVQGIKDANFLYLSFEVNADPSFDTADMIVIGFDPDGTTANQRRLHIFPLFTTGAGVGGNPQLVQYWKDSATWGGPPQALPAGTIIKVTASGAGPVAWNVEMKLPTAAAAFGIPSATSFGFYFNTLVFDSGGVVAERHWPLSSPDIQLFPNNTPSPSTWGTGDYSGGCNGVSISPLDITTNQTPTSKIATDAGNIFSVLVHNDSIDSTGAPIAANQVDATFKIANFGLTSPNMWTLVPAPGNPTTGLSTIPANGTNTLSTGTWTLSPTEITTYSTLNGGHQCILVELDSPAANTTFVNKSAWRNMDFGPASVFERPAEISGKGYEPPPGGGSSYDFDLLVTTREERSAPNKTVMAAAGNQPVSQLTWIAHGYRHTGRYIVSFRKRYEIVEDVGAFGYIVQHAGEVKAWLHELKGAGLEKIGENRYRIKVPQNGAVTVNTTIEAVEPGNPPPAGFKRWGLSLHAGASIPHGNFDNLFNPGPNVGFDLEYRLTPTFSLEGIYTFHRFRGQTFGTVSVGDLNVHQFSVNGKVYGNTSPVRPFFNFGGGAYVFTPGANTHGGLNIGGGVQFDVTPTFAIDGMYNYHNVFTSGSNTPFSTVQFGVRWRF
ncbi:MAG: hypothetical protein QOF62_2396 [Pyrinomonadaceae bacterium]|jgi:hypothetical protein|nr:hypothetical protein [Pyrinomonadaceae bacterium]